MGVNFTQNQRASRRGSENATGCSGFKAQNCDDAGGGLGGVVGVDVDVLDGEVGGPEEAGARALV